MFVVLNCPLMTVPSLTSSLTDLDEVLAEARRNSLTRDNPLLADLPDWFVGLRDHQRIAIREILCAYEEGAECVVLDAPCGSGKTLIGETVRRLLPDSRQTTYICSSKALQNQFLVDYPYAKVLKGRSNYATEGYPERFGGRDGLSASDCTKQPGDPESCMWCSNTHLCPYERAKSEALRSSLAVLNTSYFLSECNGPGRFSRGGLVICDEADTAESELMSHVEVRISERRLKSYGLGVPKYVTKEESWREWAEEAYEKVKTHPRRQLPSTDIQAIREQKRHAILVSRLKELREGLAVGGWVYTGDRNAVAFKPVTVDRLGVEKFWRHGDRFLLMSATVISADEMLESLGWDEGKEWRLVKVPSTFPAENRKVVVWPVASMTYKEKDVSYPKVVNACKEIVGRHPDDRVLIHSSSYELTKVISEALAEEIGAAGANGNPSNPSSSRHVITYTSAAEKDSALEDYLSTPRSIMVAPSLDRGIDLPGDSCRVQVIAKVPFLNLKDKQVSARLYGTGRNGKMWYAVNAIRTIVQMTGRAVRSEDDWATTYIIDSQFVINVWAMNKRLVPEWWRQGLVWRMKGLGDA